MSNPIVTVSRRSWFERLRDRLDHWLGYGSCICGASARGIDGWVRVSLGPGFGWSPMCHRCWDANGLAGRIWIAEQTIARYNLEQAEHLEAVRRATLREALL